MNILLIPDKFKGSLTAKEVIQSLKVGIQKYSLKCNFIEIIASDGGDGFLEAIENIKPIESVSCATFDSLGRPIMATYGVDIESKSAYIELARTSGITLLKPTEYNPLITSSYGTGVQIKDAINKGVKEIFIGLGGSCTNDGGIGMAQALGYAFYDKNQNKLIPNGANLNLIDSIRAPEDLSFKKVKFYAVNDVQNPLYGKDGAAYVYAEQKGADSEMIKELDDGLKNLAGIVEKEMNVDVAKEDGTGAAGGSAYGLMVFFGAEFLNGIEYILFENSQIELVKNGMIDFIITGEGSIDNQTLNGKLVSGITNLGKKYSIPTIAICGQNKLTEESLFELDNLEVLEVSDPEKSLEYNMGHASKLVEDAIYKYLVNFNI